MQMNAAMDYLAALSQNNNREWFHETQAQRKAAQCDFEQLVTWLNGELHAIDASIPPMEARALTFKMTRDTRFSHDKSPYNPSFRAHIGPQGKLPIPVGYYLMLQPGGRSFLGGGLFADMFPSATAMVRDFIAAHGSEWQAVLDEPAFAKGFRVCGTALKKVPQGYDSAHPQAEYLRYKSWYLEIPVSDEDVRADGFAEKARDVFAAMRPFNTLLNRALADFVMPAR